ncbi:MAG: YciI family protein [Alphaproteobacteria bacterium]
MLFAISCIDKPDHGAVRLENRPAHIAYLESKAGTVRFAGPYTSEDGAAMTGSLLVIEADDLAAARAFAAADPYARAGLFESVDVRPWRWVIGNPEA